MKRQYTGKDHVAAVLGKGETDRIPVVAMQTVRPIVGAAGITGKEVATRPDKHVQALVALQVLLAATHRHPVSNESDLLGHQRHQCDGSCPSPSVSRRCQYKDLAHL